MYGELYAIITAVLRGFAVIPTKKGLRHSNPSTSAFVYLVVNTAILWMITLLFYPWDQMFVSGFEFFVLAGILAPGIGANLKDIGISRLGVSISTPIVGSTTFFSLLMAVTLLGEKVTIYLLAGAVLIFLGVNLLAWGGGGKVEWKKRDIIFPLAAALLFAGSTNLRKLGLLRTDYPIIGATITSTVSLIVLTIKILVSGARNSNDGGLVLNTEALKLFVFSGVINSVAFLSYFLALSASYVVKIQPISGTNPLFSIIFSYLFLREEERITPNVIISTLLIVVGIVLITI